MPAWDEYVAAMQDLRNQRLISTRAVAAEAGGLSHATVAKILNCDYLPGRSYLRQVVLVYGGDVARFEALREAVEQESAPTNTVTELREIRVLLTDIRDLLRKQAS